MINTTTEKILQKINHSQELLDSMFKLVTESNLDEGQLNYANSQLTYVLKQLSRADTYLHL